MALPFCTLGPEGFAGFVLPIEPVSAGKASLLAQSVDVLPFVSAFRFPHNQ